MENFQSFSDWLKGRGNVANPKAYPGYLRQIQTITGEDLVKNNRPGHLNVVLMQLEGKKGFLSLKESQRKNLRSGLRAYIEFVSRPKL